MIIKLFKTILVLSLCVGVALPTNAAVSVSDGSAFVTKAEFSADLNNLSNRMAQLENSLDAKIDSLVSSYLTRNGIWNGEKQELANQWYWFSPHNSASLTTDYTWTAGNGNYIGPTKTLKLSGKCNFKTPTSYTTGQSYTTYFVQNVPFVNSVTKSGMLAYSINIGNAFTWAGQTGGTKNKLIRFVNAGTAGKQIQNVTTGINLSIKSSTGVGQPSTERNSIPLAVYINDDVQHYTGYAPASSTNSMFFFVSKGDHVSFDIYWYYLGNSDSSAFTTNVEFEYVANASNKYDYGFGIYVANCDVY